MAIANGANARRAYPEESWDAIRPRIVHYYIDEGLTLDRTMEALRREGFHATEKMYKTRIKKWGLKKYIKDEDAGAILKATQNGGVHRAHTIGGKSVTAEDARRHLKRKKIKTWGGSQAPSEALTPGSLYADRDMITSPTEEVRFGNSLFPDVKWMNNDTTARRESSEDTEMEDQWPAPESELAIVPAGNFEVSPNLLLTPGLQFATQSFLFGMRNFCDMTLNAIPSETAESFAYRRFNKLWDLFCTQATHEQQQRQSQALVVSKQAEDRFMKMLAAGDPWLLLSMCLLLNDNMSNPDRMPNSSAFLKGMAKWANRALPGHPIAQLIQYLSQTDDRGVYLLEATVRMLTERLKETIGPHHGVSLELARLHSRIMTDAGMHSSAEKLLLLDLAEIEDRFGRSSVQNLLRLSSLARCKFVADDFEGSLHLYTIILNDPLVNESWLADIKYGAMYFVAKSNAQLEQIDLAIEQTKAALHFSLDTKGPDHYWANNAKELIEELEMHKRFEIIDE